MEVRNVRAFQRYDGHDTRPLRVQRLYLTACHIPPAFIAFSRGNKIISIYMYIGIYICIHHYSNFTIVNFLHS